MIKMGACQSHEQHNNVEGELKSISDTISLVKSVVMSSEESEVSELAKEIASIPHLCNSLKDYFKRLENETHASLQADEPHRDLKRCGEERNQADEQMIRNETTHDKHVMGKNDTKKLDELADVKEKMVPKAELYPAIVLRSSCLKCAKGRGTGGCRVFFVARKDCGFGWWSSLLLCRCQFR